MTAALPRAGAEAGGSTAVGARWVRWALAATLAALVIGIVLYPDVHEATMPVSMALAIVLGATGVLLLSGRIRLAVLLPLVAAYLPSQQIGFAAYLLALLLLAAAFAPVRLRFRLDAVDGLFLGVLAWATMSWIANLGIETDGWSLPLFALTFFAPWLTLWLARVVPWTEADLRRIVGVWLALGASQVVTALVKPLLLGTPESYAVPLLLLQAARMAILQALTAGHVADFTFGTMPSAHHLGVAMLLLSVFVCAFAVATRRLRPLAFAAAAFFVFLMTDSKHVVLAAIVPAALVLSIVVWPQLGVRWRRRVGVAGVLAGIVVLAFVGTRIADLVISGLWRPYVTLATINPKVQLVVRTANRMSEGGLATWIGHGPGSFASRAATIRASDVLYKERSQLPGIIPSHTGQAYRRVAYDLYTSDIALTTGFRSGALTNPFSSVVGIIAEFGVLGTTLVGAFLWVLTARMFATWREERLEAAWRAAAATAGFGVPLLVLLGIFDSYFEQPDVTAVMLPLLLIGLVAGAVPRSAAAP